MQCICSYEVSSIDIIYKVTNEGHKIRYISECKHKVLLCLVLVWLYHQFLWMHVIYYPFFQPCFISNEVGVNRSVPKHDNTNYIRSSQWRHNERNGVSNHPPYDCLLNRLFKAQIKENVKALPHWPLCGDSIWWRHHVMKQIRRHWHRGYHFK